MDSKERGLYEKFKIERTDGRSEPGEKHDGCPYFVLDCRHDPHAADALEAYAASCDTSYPELAKDVRKLRSELLADLAGQAMGRYVGPY